VSVVRSSLKQADRSGRPPRPAHTVRPEERTMLARRQTFSLFGIEAVPVDVDVDVSGG
jgi:hypothetical protein